MLAMGSRGLNKAAIIWCMCAVLTACGGGGGSKEPTGAVVAPTGDKGNRVPAAALDMGGATAQPDGTVHVHTGAILTADASGSQDPDGDALTYNWVLLKKPTGSKASLINGSGSQSAKAYLTTDVKGSYEFAVTVDDGKGGVTSQIVTVVADNTAPDAVASITIDPQSTTKKVTRSVSLGSLVTLDTSGSLDADGDPLSTSWAVTTYPADTGLSAYSGTGSSFRFTADKLGTFRVQARTADPKGGVSVTEVTVLVDNQAPTGVVAVFSPPTATQSTSSLNTSLGYQVLLNGGASKDADGDPLTYQWHLLSAPAGSKLALINTTKPTQIFSPDVLGTYTVRLTVTDTKGAQGENTLTLVVDNNRPVATIESNATPQAQASAPQVRVPANVPVTLRGDSSYDADGDAMAYQWNIVSRPDGSLRGLSGYNQANVTFTPDRDGLYVFSLRVTDTKGASSEKQVDIVVGGGVPTVTLDRTRVMATLNEAVSFNALASLSSAGDPITYSWTLDTAPAGSALVSPTSTTSTATITPDVPGTYMLTVKATSGKFSASTTAVIAAEKSWSGNFALDFRPEKVYYNRAQDLTVMTVSSPSPAIKIVDLIGNTVSTVNLPKPISALGISPDGQHIAVAHDALVSYIDVRKASLINSVVYGSNVSSAILNNNGVVYLAGRLSGGGSWNGSIVLDLNTGKVLNGTSSDLYWARDSFYGYLTSVYADKVNKFFYMEWGLSPADIDYQVIDPKTNVIVAGGDSPYHGDHPMGGTLWLNEDQSVVFTSAGTMFNTDTLTYAGTLNGIAGAVSFSQSKAANEIIVVVQGSTGPYYNSTPALLPSYRRFVGTFMAQVDDVPLPLIDGQQSYAVQAFHTAAGKPLVLAQVGSNTPNAAAATYYLVFR